MSTNVDIGLARKQRAFAKMETVVGTMVFPSGTTDFIRPAGNAAINQTPAFADSEELANTLDVLDQFQGATPAGKWNLVMYLRPNGTINRKAAFQGNVLLKVLQGLSNTTLSSTAATVSSMSAAIATVHLGGITIATGLVLPVNGVIGVGSEYIRYTGIQRALRTSTAATLTGCTRGYGSTSATAHTGATAASLISHFYMQTTASPTFSLWIETDHFVQGLSGCSVESATFDMAKDGAVKLTMDGQGMQMVYAGSTTVSRAAVATNTHIHITNANLFTPGAYVRCSTATTMIKKIVTVVATATTATSQYLTFGSVGIGAVIASGDTIRGYLPDGTEIGDPIESKDIVAKISGVTAKVKTGSIAFKTPKKYIEDEIGTTYPEDFMEDKRDITSTLSLYFRKNDAKYFTEGYAGTEVPVLVTFGDTPGSIVDVYLPRCKLTVPTINYASPAVELSIPIKALGTVGEDSAEIIVR